MTHDEKEMFQLAKLVVAEMKSAGVASRFCKALSDDEELAMCLLESYTEIAVEKFHKFSVMISTSPERLVVFSKLMMSIVIATD